MGTEYVIPHENERTEEKTSKNPVSYYLIKYRSCLLTIYSREDSCHSKLFLVLDYGFQRSNYDFQV